ncbi:hypothetical protein AVEN_108934-1 [Araneus ventricosus]|uniref:Uncharacterized protein n=1 Tax=Araneus ventricosus TaxID=182803 RepID=A0A4Y2EQA5_ARAVE|nr:hypothetical protein AVEN_108934-1 [Araneus ventricosus]
MALIQKAKCLQNPGLELLEILGRKGREWGTSFHRGLRSSSTKRKKPLFQREDRIVCAAASPGSQVVPLCLKRALLMAKRESALGQMHLPNQKPTPFSIMQIKLDMLDFNIQRRFGHRPSSL